MNKNNSNYEVKWIALNVATLEFEEKKKQFNCFLKAKEFMSEIAADDLCGSILISEVLKG